MDRDYLHSFACELRDQMWRFWKTQVIVGLAAGFGGLLIGWKLRFIEVKNVSAALLILVGGYAAVVTVFLLTALIRIPVILDARRSEEIGRLRAEIERLRKRPYDAALEKRARAFLDTCKDETKKLLRFLVEHGEQPEHELTRLFGSIAVEEARASSVVNRTERWRGPSMDFYFNVAPNFVPVLKDLLYD